MFKEDWGEQLVGVCHPIIAILDVANEDIKVVEGIPENLSAGQVNTEREYFQVFNSWARFLKTQLVLQ